MDPKVTGEFILKLRKNQNLTQAELAEKLGVTDKAVSRWETGKGYPDVVSLVTIGDFFGVSVNELLSGEYLSTDEFKIAADKNITDIIKSEQTHKHRHKIFKALVIALLLIVIGKIVFMAGSYFMEIQQMQFELSAPTKTVKIDGITTDYKKIDKYDLTYGELFNDNFEIAQLKNKVKGSNLYTVSGSDDVLANLFAYERVSQSESAIYVKLEKLKTLPHSLDEAEVTGFYLCQMGYENGIYLKHFYPLSLSLEQVENGMNFYSIKKKYEKYPDPSGLEYENKVNLNVDEEPSYSIYCSVNGVDGLLFKYPYECIFNDNDGKYYLLNSHWSCNNIYEIPDEYQKTIKSALENK